MALAQACRSCGYDNDAGDKFCGGCGIDLSQTPVPVVEPAPVVPEAGMRERRQVTVLFADISSFTRMSKVLDPEDTYAILQSFFGAADGIIERFGGTIDKHIGDAVMALFGAPIAHDDDPLRAVRAASELHSEVERLSETLPHELKVHIGIAAGEVVAGGIGTADRSAYTVIGDSVNFAALLQENAGAGETFISDSVYEAASHAFECAEVPLPDGQKGWRVLAAQNGFESEAVAPIVGRDRELRHVASLLESAKNHKRGEAVLIRGDAGIGKTRIVQEYQKYAREQGYTNHAAHVLDFGAGTGQDAIRILMRSLLGIDETSSKECRAKGIAKAKSQRLVGADAEIFLYDLLEAPAPPDIAVRYDAMDNSARLDGKTATLCEIIRNVAARAPVMLTIEDLHWAQPVTLDYLARLLDGMADLPVVVVMTTRSEGDPMAGIWREGLRGVSLFSIDLNPLGKLAAKEMATQLFGSSTQFVSDCIARADGNPLFLQQLLRSAEDQDARHLPATIQSLVLSRIDRLSKGEKNALQAASVAGQRVELRLLDQLLGQRNYETKTLVDRQLMRADGDELVFTHSLIRDGVYSSLLKSSARKLHAQAAAYYEDHDLILRAEHLDKAKDPDAPSAYLDAARAALDDHHTGQAILLVDRGIEISDQSQLTYQLQMVKGQVLQALDHRLEAVEAYRAALELASVDIEKCAPIIGMVKGMRDGHQLEDALKLLETGEAIAANANEPAYLAQIHAQRGNLFFPRGRVDACHAEQQKSLFHAKAAGSARLEAEAFSGLGDAEYMRGRMGSANTHFSQCVALCEEHDFLATLTPNLALRGLTHFYCGLPKICVQDCTQAIEMAEGARQMRAELVARTALAPALIELGEFDAAAVQAEKATGLIEALGASRFMPQCLSFKARIAKANGQPKKALSFAQEAVKLSEQSDAARSFTGPWAYGTLALVSQDDRVRNKALSAGRALLEKGSVSHNFFWFYRDAIEVRLRTENWEAAVDEADALLGFMASEQILWPQYYGDLARNVANLHVEGRSDDRTSDIQNLRSALVGAGLEQVVQLLDDTLPKP